MLSIRKYLKSVFYILLSEGFGDHDKYSGELLVLHISVTARRSGLGNEDLDKQETLKLPPSTELRTNTVVKAESGVALKQR